MMSIFKDKNSSLTSSQSLGVDGAGAEKEAYDYVIDAIQETNITSSFVSNARETSETAQESSIEPTAPRKIIYGETKVGGNIVWRISEIEGETQFAIVWGQGEVEEVTEIFLDGQGVNATQQLPLGYFAGNYVGESMLGGSSNSISDSFLISKKPNYWDGLHFFGGCCWSYIFLRFNATAFPRGFPEITAKIQGRKIYDPRKDSTAGSILHNSALGTTHRFNNTSTWEYSANAALCLLNYMTDDVMGMGEPISKFDEQSLRDAIDKCEETIQLSGGTSYDRYTCHGVIYANRSHRENIKQILTSMNGKLVYSNGKYHIKPYAYETPHSQIIDESMIVGSIKYSAKQGRADTYNRVKGKFNSKHDDFITTDYPVQYSSADADGLTYDDKDGDTLYLDYNLPLVTTEQVAQRLARLMLLRSRMQSTVTFTTNMKGLVYKIGDTIQFSNDLLGFTSGFEKDFEITDYKILNDTENGITVEITGKEVVQAIYNWQASDAIDYTANELIDVWDGFLPAPTNFSLEKIQVIESINEPETGFRYTFDFSTDNENQLKHFEIELFDVISRSVTQTWTVTEKDNIFIAPSSAYYSVPFQLSVRTVSTMDKKSEWIVATVQDGLSDNVFLLDQPPNFPSFYYLPSTNLNTPTETQFQNYFGFKPKENDAIIVYTESNGIVTDSKKYIFKPEMSVIFTVLKNLGNMSDPQNPDPAEQQIQFRLNGDAFVGSLITWTYQIFDFNGSHLPTAPTGISSTGGQSALQTYTFTLNTSFYPNERHFEEYGIEVTATWATGSVTSRHCLVRLLNDY